MIPVVRAGAEGVYSAGRTEHAVLLLHGFGDTPQTFYRLIPTLESAGLTVSAPLLPGHGTTVEEFNRSTAADWLAASRGALRSLQNTHENVGVVGLSMGGALAVVLAASERVSAVVLLAPYMAMPAGLAALAILHLAWGRFRGPAPARSDRTILDPDERKKNLGYPHVTAHALHELWRLTRAANHSLRVVAVPTLIVQSRRDNRIRAEIAERTFRRLGSTEKRLLLTHGGGHIITVDHGWRGVVAEVCAWLGAHPGQPSET